MGEEPQLSWCIVTTVSDTTLERHGSTRNKYRDDGFFGSIKKVYIRFDNHLTTVYQI